MLPELNIAIEVDGPSHNRKIWTQEQFEKRQKADNQKTALVLSKGLALIRIQQKRNLTRKFKNDISEKLLKIVDNIRAEFPEEQEHRNFLI